MAQELTEEFDTTVPRGLGDQYRLDEWRPYHQFEEVIGKAYHQAGQAQQRMMWAVFTGGALKNLTRTGLVETRPGVPTSRVLEGDWDGKDFRIPRPCTFFDEVKGLDAEIRLGGRT